MKQQHNEMTTNTHLDVNSLNIMVVDDQPFVTEIMRQSLLNAGVFEVYVVKNVQEALKTLKTNKIDMIFTDFNMPEFNGLELLKFIRSNNDKSIRELPVIMLTAYSDTAVVKIAMQLDVTGFITKPACNTVIMERLNSVVEKTQFFHSAEYYQAIMVPKLETEVPTPKEEKPKVKTDKPVKNEGRCIPLDDAIPGDVLNYNIHDSSGKLMLHKGSELTEQLIEKLKKVIRLKYIHVI